MAYPKHYKDHIVIRNNTLRRERAEATRARKQGESMSV